MMGGGEPVRYTAEPDSSHDAAKKDQTPFLLKLLVCFLVLDGAERAIELVVWALNASAQSELAPSPYYPNIPASLLWILVHFLLAILLFLRTWWGRIWTQAIFLIHILFIGQEIVLKNPEIWIYMDSAGRMRLLFTVVLDMAVVLYLFTAQARDHLRR